METISPAPDLRISFPSDLYELEAVKLAAYRFANEASVELEPVGERLLCILKPLGTSIDLEKLEARFRCEVIDQDLRKRIARETEGLRNLVLAHAFSKTGLSA